MRWKDAAATMVIGAVVMTAAAVNADTVNFGKMKRITCITVASGMMPPMMYSYCGEPKEVSGGIAVMRGRTELARCVNMPVMVTTPTTSCRTTDGGEEVAE